MKGAWHGAHQKKWKLNLQKGIESPDPEVSANVMIGLVNITSYVLAKQIKTLEAEFFKGGRFARKNVESEN